MVQGIERPSSGGAGLRAGTVPGLESSSCYYLYYGMTQMEYCQRKTNPEDDDLG